MRDFIVFELLHHVSFDTLLIMARTCKHFARAWKSFVHIMPDHLKAKQTEDHLRMFPHLTDIFIHGESKISIENLTILPALTTLELRGAQGLQWIDVQALT